MSFISVETVKAVVLLFFAILLFIVSFRINKKNKYKSYKTKIAFITLILIAIPFIEAYSLKSNMELNFKQFISGRSFICINNNFHSYKVSKDNGWNKEGIYFNKDSLLVRADKCEEQ